MLGGRPVTRLIVTHFHPDHAGNSGWICEKWGLRPRMSHGEWLTANLAILNRNTDHLQSRATFYRRHGLDDARAKRFIEGVVLYRDGVTLPPDHKRLRGGDIVAIGARPLAGDHRRGPFAGARLALLRRAQNPDRRRPDPAEHHHQRQHLAGRAGVRRGRRVPEDLQDLPRRARIPTRWCCRRTGRPFRNVQHRLRELAEHHAMRLNLILENAGARDHAPAS